MYVVASYLYEIGTQMFYALHTPELGGHFVRAYALQTLGVVKMLYRCFVRINSVKMHTSEDPHIRAFAQQFLDDEDANDMSLLTD